MPERPLLLFPTPQPATRTKRPSYFGCIHKPSITRQGQRLSPMFNQLQAAFEERRVEIQQNTMGIDPEQVLVIETIGSVDNFANAVKNIEGLEWMGELERDEIVPDQDFYDEKDPKKELNGRLYMVMTNQRALKQMLSLWTNYQTDPEIQFDHGLTKFRDVFLNLKSIRHWDVQDRLLETGLMDRWQKELSDELFRDDRNRLIPFEAELWFRGSNELRVASANNVKNLVQQAGGRILSQSVIEGITYHALLAELPAYAIQSIIENPRAKLVKCENVMFFRPVGQMMVKDNPPEDEVENACIEEIPLPIGEPIVALFDGVPLTNHRLLAGRMIVDDPENWEADYGASERVHGSSMASLIIHGDLNQPRSPLSRPIYVRPIMKPVKNWFNVPRPEAIPENCLIVDLIHCAVKRLFEGEQGEGPAASHVKVINLSIGDPNRQFTQTMSPLARLLDWLSIKYNVLFIVSAGNHPTEISLGVSKEKFDSFKADEKEGEIIKALYRDVRHRKLLSPAETINGISVGAVHLDEAHITCQGDRIDPFTRPLPSPVSAFGSGYRRAIKPDIIFYGGRQLYRLSLKSSNPVTIKPVISRSAPGNKVASPGNLPGELNATVYSCGTSNATALITRAASICYDSLQQIFNEQSAEIDPLYCEVPLLKAMLVHSCSWGNIGSRIYEVLRTPQNKHQIRGLISRWMGYGIPVIERVLDCTEQRATVLGFGQLSDGEAHVFSLPLPPSLDSRPIWRRLTVTLAWLSPISTKSQKYRIASLWFEIKDKRLVPTRKNVDGRAVIRGTVQHEVFEGDKAEPFIDGDIINIKVNCRKDAGKIQSSVPYGLAVSLEVAEGIDIAIYDEIRTRIAPAIQIQQSINQERE